MHAPCNHERVDSVLLGNSTGEGPADQLDKRKRRNEVAARREGWGLSSRPASSLSHTRGCCYVARVMHPLHSLGSPTFLTLARAYTCTSYARTREPVLFLCNIFDSFYFSIFFYFSSFLVWSIKRMQFFLLRTMTYQGICIVICDVFEIMDITEQWLSGF